MRDNIQVETTKGKGNQDEDQDQDQNDEAQDDEKTQDMKGHSSRVISKEAQEIQDDLDAALGFLIRSCKPSQ